MTAEGMLDTNILILRSRIDPRDLPDRAAISAVALGELAAGVHLVRADAPDADVVRAERIALLQQAEAEFDPVPYDAAAARMYGRMCAAVARLGRIPRARAADLMIAATAATEALPLFTTNPDDYRGLDALVDIVAVPRPASDRR
ncbi:type II toxin-antitoxin system VapC family toxin [Microbacterium sp.]|uniref:type II toxin-antitoxin system VapC family toxin n=1 Tax=Microbacterium sp. TaxID=51671 RepID=UPI0039E6E47A